MHIFHSLLHSLNSISATVTSQACTFTLFLFLTTKNSKGSATCDITYVLTFLKISYFWKTAKTGTYAEHGGIISFIKSKKTITGNIVKIKLLQGLELQRRIALCVIILRMFPNMTEFQQQFKSLFFVKVHNGLIFQFINLEHDFTSGSSQRN